MEEREARAILARQREFFHTGATLPVRRRKEGLRRLLRALEDREEALCAALWADLGKSPAESYMCELGLVKSEIGYMLRHLGAFARERRVRTPLAQFWARSSVKPSPYGCVLIMSPWNYPVLLALDPLVDALAAGNTAVVKPSAYSPHVSRALAELLGACFDPREVAVVTGGRAENQCLLGLPFDYIFFTGSPAVGREVMAQAARHLTPVTLELGGKSPCIVDETADLDLAARRIVFGKFINCGQTCVAPDYVYCAAAVRDRLVEALGREIARQYGPAPLDDPDYGRMVNGKHFDRVAGLIDPRKVAVGGQTRPEALAIAPTVLRDVTWADPVMEEEIFGPVLPVLTWEDFDEVVATLQSRPAPLALYVFSADKGRVETLKSRVAFGGGCVNDCLVHLATSAMGFGGVGESGMGAYHGRRGFETFTHYKSLVDKKTLVDLSMRYRPLTAKKVRLIRKFVK